MTYFQTTRGSHLHRWFVDGISGDSVCLCGVTKGIGEKRAKYHNRSSTYNGITYHSQLEANYAAELDLRMRAREIVSWDRQVKLDLKVNGHHINNYYLDFIVHYPDGSREFVEVKGLALEPWKTNWKILEATFDQFKQHPDDRLLVVKETRTRFRRR